MSHVESGPAGMVVVASVVGRMLPEAVLLKAVKIVSFFEMPGPSVGRPV